MGVIRVVLTDLDGVIRRWPATQFSSVEDAHGLPRGSMARAAFHETLLTDAITGVVTDAEWRKRIAARLGAQFDPAAAAAAVAAWSASAGDVHTSTLDVLQAARRTVALGLVSNATTRLAADLSRLPTRSTSSSTRRPSAAPSPPNVSTSTPCAVAAAPANKCSSSTTVRKTSPAQPPSDSTAIAIEVADEATVIRAPRH